MSLQHHQYRVIAEKTDLDMMRGKLAAFLTGDKFNSLPTAERTRLLRQRDAMEAYSTVLGERIAAFNEEEEEEKP